MNKLSPSSLIVFIILPALLWGWEFYREQERDELLAELAATQAELAATQAALELCVNGK